MVPIFARTNKDPFSFGKLETKINKFLKSTPDIKINNFSKIYGSWIFKNYSQKFNILHKKLLFIEYRSEKEPSKCHYLESKVGKFIFKKFEITVEIQNSNKKLTLSSKFKKKIEKS